MLTFENQNIEFKQEYVPDIRKEVMGFTNADGGTVFVGSMWNNYKGCTFSGNG